jgi:hemerythrin-like domain-containing protein
MNKKYFILIFLFNITNYSYLFTEKKEVIMNRKKEEFEIPLTEDLMREHGILNRILLIYEEIIKRIENSIDFSVLTLAQAINIIKSFIEDYHENLEDVYVFPLFEKHKKEIRLIKTLKKQHIKGREIASQLQKLSATTQLTKDNKKFVHNLLQKFIKMCRPHEAREDTVLFPQVRSLISEREFLELGEKFETLEYDLFGEDGFEAMVKRVESIEKELDIYNLGQFTPTKK